MKRLIISILVLCLLACFSFVPTFAQASNSISGLLLAANGPTSTGNQETTTPKTNYVAELNKIGIAGRPESDNAAPYYQQAIELYVKQPQGLEVSPKVWPKEQPAQQQAMLRRWVQDNSRALEQLELASQKSYYWVKHTGEKLQTEMPHLGTIRELAFALQARAMLSAEDGNMTSALNDTATLYIIGAQVSSGPRLLVEKLAGIAIKSFPIRFVFDILDRKMVDVTSMKSLEGGFKQLVADYSEAFDIRGEKIYLQEGLETDPKYHGFKGMLKSTLEYYDAAAAKTPMQLRNEQAQSTNAQDPSAVLGGSIARVIELEYRVRTDEQALITTLAILRYNAGSGAYPESLPQLVSAGYIEEVPKDPFSGESLVYKQTERGFTLYSFGTDYDDDGGVHRKRGAEGGDQVFWPVEQTQVAQRQTGREGPDARPGSPQRRPTTYARSAAQPYLIDDEQETVPARSRPARGTASGSLHQAVVDGDIDQVQLLLSQGADVNMKNPRLGWTPLHTAARNRRKEVAELLIAKGAEVNAKEGGGQTPLHFAVDEGQKDMVELLIAKGADVNIVSGRRETALSVARKEGHTEIADLLVKHGGEEPSLQDLQGDRYYAGRAGLEGPNQYADGRRGIQPRGRTGTIGQSPGQVDILADPNEIKARVKTFEDLEKALGEVAGKSQSEVLQWQQKRYDNRTLLARAVKQQFEEEMGFVKKVAVEEKAKKTAEAIDSMLSQRQERFKNVSKELLAQKREMRQMQQSPRTRGRGRTSGRSTRGRYPQRGQTSGGSMTDPLYDRGPGMPGMNRYEGMGPQSDQPDREAQDEIRQWLQATADNRADLARAVHQQILAETGAVRTVAVEEKAKKTTAAIDGLLLARQGRFDALVAKIEEERMALQQIQDPRNLGRSGGRYLPGGPTQQQNQPRTRTRRR